MNINWDEELQQYFLPKYLKTHLKIKEAFYRVTTLEGKELEFECSIQGYRCKCHNKVYELPIGMFKQHSDEYKKAFSNQLFDKLLELQKSQEGQEEQEN